MEPQKRGPGGRERKDYVNKSKCKHKPSQKMLELKQNWRMSNSFGAVILQWEKLRPWAIISVFQ